MIDSKTNEKSNSTNRLALLLTHIAVAGWIVSLALPSFTVDGEAEVMYGGFILLWGLPFGWLSNGWAVYANLFFPFVVIRLYQGRGAPVATILMLVLLLTLFFFKNVMVNEGGTLKPVASWGWGALLWASSLAAAGTASAAQAGWVGQRGMVAIVVLLGLVLPAAGVTHYLQRQKANLQEQELYLSHGMAITTVEFCGVPFVWPQSAVVPAGERITLEVDESLKSDKGNQPYLELPGLSNMQEGNFAWRTFYHPVDPSRQKVKVRAAAQPTRYVLQVHRATQGALIRLVDTHTNAALYEQQLKIRWRRSDWMQYCPFATTSMFGTEMGYGEAILRAVGQQYPSREPVRATVQQVPTNASMEPLRTEAARLPCSLGDKDIDGTPGLREWDGRQVIFEPEAGHSQIGFCSDSYIGLVSVHTIGSRVPDDMISVVQLFDRKTIRPLAIFNDGRPCPSRAGVGSGCEKVPKTIVKGFRVEGNSVTVETERGELQAHRITR